MSFTITDYCDISQQAQSLGLNTPDGIALLPRNYDTASDVDELLHESAVHTIRSLFRQNGIEETRIEQPEQEISCIQENEFALVLPALFVSGLILTAKPPLLAVALGVISNYATDFFKGIPGRKKVVIDIIVEDKSKKISKKIHYEGEAEGLKEITEIAGKVFTDE